MPTTSNNNLSISPAGQTDQAAPAGRLTGAWPSRAEIGEDALLSEGATHDDAGARSEVASLCANVQADVGHLSRFGDLAGLIQALYALTTALASAETHPPRRG